MKKDIHPEYHIATVTCSCGNSFQTGSTKAEIRVELCSACHPFFTGKQKIIDTAGKVEKFKKRMEAKKDNLVSKKEKRLLKRKQRLIEEISRPTSLDEVRKSE